MEHRIKELDYLKSILILLMVAFHLVYIGDKYPYIKQIVYTFHMPAFLIISGYLTNVQKDIMDFHSLSVSGNRLRTHVAYLTRERKCTGNQFKHFIA